MTTTQGGVGHDPLFPQSTLLPLSHVGGVQLTIDNVPGQLRPFAATLGVPRPLDGKKHDTTSTSETKSTNSQTSKDGQVVTDTVSDTSTDT
jgi:hypothetical protein